MASISQDHDLAKIFQRLSDSYRSVSSGPNVSPKAKAELRSAALELIGQISTPHENAMLFVLQNAVHPCYRIAADCGIFFPWTKETMTAKELAGKTGADQRLIVRIMRVLTGSRVFKEVAEETYAHSALSRALNVPGFLTTSKFLSPAMARLPEYLAATSYTNPGSNPETSTLFQYGNATPLTFYQAMGASPSVRSGFDHQMRTHVQLERARYCTGFASIFDFENEIAPLVEGPEDVALVDVGGSRGHVLEDVRTHVPGLKGRLVLQDLPGTVEGLVGEGFEVVGYDFLGGVQPIKGALCYLFRQIFLNWSDARGLQILQNTLPAMTPGRSRLLIMEPVLPPVSAPLPAALLDIQMSQMGGGLRTEKQWRAFLEEAGFEVKRFLPSNSNQTVIEAMVKS